MPPKRLTPFDLRPLPGSSLRCYNHLRSRAATHLGPGGANRMPTPSATELLLSLSQGNRAALNDLIPLVYEELRAIARRRLRHERPGHTLNTTALVHEAYLKLIELDRVQWQSRAHFLAIAAQAMRNILVNHALRRKRIKRGGGAPHTTLKESAAETATMPVAEADRILALDEALKGLAELNPRHARIV